MHNKHEKSPLKQFISVYYFIAVFFIIFENLNMDRKTIFAADDAEMVDYSFI